MEGEKTKDEWLYVSVEEVIRGRVAKVVAFGNFSCDILASLRGDLFVPFPLFGFLSKIILCDRVVSF